MGDLDNLNNLDDLGSLDNIEVKQNEPMSLHTTFKVGGTADLFVVPANCEEIQKTLVFARNNHLELHVLGQGSNVLVSDNGVRGVVLYIGSKLSSIAIEDTTVRVQAGALNKDVASAACAAGLAGYEFASGIPGSVGGAAIMNAGAYDGQFADVCTQVECITPDGNLVVVDAASANWSYRHSMMADNGYIVVGATLALTKDNPQNIQMRMDELDARRKAKQPLEFGSAGSTFKRPVGYFAGKLIQDAGLRGYSHGGAQVSEKHCGFVVNTGNATASDVLYVIQHVQDVVEQKFGVRLQPEVKMWGFDA